MKSDISTVKNIKARSPIMPEKVKRNIIGWLLMLPGCICFIVFVIQPIIVGAYMSFFETQGFEAVKFVGLQNYKDVIADSLFLKSILNSAKYCFWSVLIGGFTPLIIATMLNEVVRGKTFFRFATYFPCIIPGIVTSIMWKILFQPDANGFLNMILGKFGIEPLQWLQNPSMTIPLIVFTMTWAAFGSTTLIYLASLQSIDNSLYEAAEIDGAGFFNKIRHVTFPHVSGMLKMLLLLQIMGVFKVFQEPLAMTGGGPNNASTSIMLTAYNYAFSYMQVGRSTALGMIIAVILCVFSIVYFKITGEKKQR